jgi:hypothetical protein
LADGQGVVADFGIARVLVAAGGDHPTETGLALLTCSSSSGACTVVLMEPEAIAPSEQART